MDQLALDIIKTALYNAPVTKGTVTLEILDQFREHTIHALVADAVLKYDMASGVREKVEQYLALQMKQYAEYMSEQGRVVKTLLKEGVIPVILKGSSSAMYYPEPGLRAMGDIDLMVFPKNDESFDIARKALCGMGFTESEEQEQRLLNLNKGKLEIEMHRVFTNSRTQNEKRIEELLCNSTPVEQCASGYSHVFYSFPVQVNGIILLEHISRHIYSGLGLRQIIDWLMYVDAVLNEDFWANKFRPIVSKVGLETLAKVTTRMGEIYLGTPQHAWCSDVDEACCEQLFQLIDEAGNFGRSLNFKDKSTKSVLNNRITFKKLQQRGLSHWPAAQKHKLLSPFAWLYQIFRYIKKGLKRDKNSVGLVANYKEHRKQKQLFAALGIPHEEEKIAKH